MVKNIQISPAEFRQISQFVRANYGINLSEQKLLMVKGRLQKRLRQLSINTVQEYLELVFSQKGHYGEMIEMINLLTTNKTDFFREAAHFQYLEEHLLGKLDWRRPIRVWSAGSSSGEEAYTIAICILEFQRQKSQSGDFQIFASDLSTQVLEKGRKAIYPEERIALIPMELKQRYFLRSKDPNKKMVRIKKSLRDKVQFAWLNFMNAQYEVSGQFEIIFCRNTLIYFDRKTQKEVLDKLCRYLKPGGHLFIGHSESIHNLGLPLIQKRPTIYQKTETS